MHDSHEMSRLTLFWSIFTKPIENENIGHMMRAHWHIYRQIHKIYLYNKSIENIFLKCSM